jgi:hypothetical protein
MPNPREKSGYSGSFVSDLIAGRHMWPGTQPKQTDIPALQNGTLGEECLYPEALQDTSVSPANSHSTNYSKFIMSFVADALGRLLVDIPRTNERTNSMV